MCSTDEFLTSPGFISPRPSRSRARRPVTRPGLCFLTIRIPLEAPPASVLCPIPIPPSAPNHRTPRGLLMMTHPPNSGTATVRAPPRARSFISTGSEERRTKIVVKRRPGLGANGNELSKEVILHTTVEDKRRAYTVAAQRSRHHKLEHFKKLEGLKETKCVMELWKERAIAGERVVKNSRDASEVRWGSLRWCVWFHLKFR